MGAEQNHLRIDIRDKKGHIFKLIAFYAPENWLTLTPEDKIVPLVKLIENDFNGIRSAEARIIDVDVL